MAREIAATHTENKLFGPRQEEQQTQLGKVGLCLQPHGKLHNLQKGHAHDGVSVSGIKKTQNPATTYDIIDICVMHIFTAKYSSYLIQTIFPSLMMVLTSYASLYVPRDQVQIPAKFHWHSTSPKHLTQHRSQVA
jgi:hypothetical protein